MSEHVSGFCDNCMGEEVYYDWSTEHYHCIDCNKVRKYDFTQMFRELKGGESKDDKGKS